VLDKPTAVPESTENKAIFVRRGLLRVSPFRSRHTFGTDREDEIFDLLQIRHNQRGH
jgi:hypothetical protein